MISAPFASACDLTRDDINVRKSVPNKTGERLSYRFLRAALATDANRKYPLLCLWLQTAATAVQRERRTHERETRSPPFWAGKDVQLNFPILG